MIKFRHTIALMAFAACMAAEIPASGVIIEWNTGKRMSGYMVSESDTFVELKQRQEDGTWKVSKYPITGDTLVLRTIKETRLLELDPSNPQTYRDYAEELAVKKEDIEARDMAIRLYQIAAYKNREELGESCLLGMAKLGRTAAERRKFSAMAYLLDKEHDKSRLKAPPRVVTKVKKPTRNITDFKTLLKILRDIRSGKPARKKSALWKLGEKKSLVEAYSPFEDLISLGDLRAECRRENVCSECTDGVSVCRACDGTGKRTTFGSTRPCSTCRGRKRLACVSCYGITVVKSMPSDKLAQLLRVELKLMEIIDGKVAEIDEPVDVAPDAKAVATARRWSDITVDGPSPVPAMSLLHLTEFDPRASKYRDDKWVVPASE
jgi:hypothetical protein